MRKFYSPVIACFLAVLFSFSGLDGLSQPWSYNFGTSTGAHTTGSSTTFLPAASSGTTTVRIGSAGGSFNMENQAITFGSQSYLRGVASTSGSLNFAKLGGFGNPTSSTYIKFKVRLGSAAGTNTATSGQWHFVMGTGTSFTTANSALLTEYVAGLRWTFGAAGAITTASIVTGAYTTAVTGFSQASDILVEVYLNNSASATSYYRSANSTTYNIASRRYDLWVGGSLVQDDVAVNSTGPSSGTAIDSWMFYGGSSTSNVANVFVDDIEYSNSLPSNNPALTPSPTTLTGLTYVQGSGPSVASTFTLSAANLTGAPGNITISESTDYEVSTTDATAGFGPSATLAYTGAATLTTNTVWVRLKAGRTAGNYNSQSIGISGGGATSSVTVSGSVSAPPPANDDCVSATTLAINAAATAGTLTASTVTGSNTFTYGPTKKDVWYKFTPTCSGSHTVTLTFSSGPDIDIDLFTASCPTGGTATAVSHGSTTTETITSTLVGGTTYYIRVIEWTATASAFNIAVATSVTPTFTLANTGTPAAGAINVNSANSLLYGFALTPNACTSSFDFTGVTITTAGTATSADISNLQLVYDVNGNGIYEGGTDVIVSASAQALSTSVTFSVTGQAGLTAVRRYLLIGDVAANATAGNTFTGSLSNANVTASVTVTGSAAGNERTISATPLLTAGALAAFSSTVCVNTTTSENSFTLSGVNLNGSDVTLAALPGYSYSLVSGGPYNTTLTLPAFSGASTPIYVVFSPTLAQAYNGNIIISGGGSADVTVATSGTGVNTVPTVTAGTVVTFGQTTATVPGSIPSIGCSAVSAYGVEYSTTNGFANGTGTTVAGSNLSGSNFSVAITGLSANTTYYFKTYATNGGGTGTSTQQSFTTLNLTAPVATAATAVNGTGFTANWGTVANATSYRLDVGTSASFGAVANVATEGFENALSLFTQTTGIGTYSTGTSGTGDRPASSPYTVAGTHSFGRTGGSVIITSADINTQSVTSPQLSFRLAAFSVGSTGNGMDGGDIVTVEISPDGGSTFYSTVRVLGNGNAFWAYSATGLASTAYDGNAAPVDFAPTSGGSRTTDGYSTVTITGLPSATNMRIRITLLNDNTAERWVIDDLAVSGVGSSYVAGYNNLTVNATSQAVMGLAANTTYYYRVRATDGVATSPNSNTITTGTFNNEATADFRSVTTGNYSSISTWEYNTTGSTYVPATMAPTGNNNVTIRAGHTVTLDDITNIGSGKTLTVESGGNLQLGTSVLGGTGNFDLQSGGTLGIGGTNSIAAINNSGTKTFSTGANYIYNGSGTTQNTGAGLPATVASLTIDKSGGSLALTNPLAAASLVLTSGTFNAGNNALSLASISRTSGSLNASSAALTFTNSGVLAVPASAIATTIGSLTTSGTGVVTLGNAHTVTGSVSIGSTGGLGLGGDIAVGGDWTRASTASFTHNNFKITMNGSAAQTITITGGGTASWQDLEIANTSGGVSLASGTNLSLAGTLTLTSGSFSIGVNNLTLVNPISGTSSNLAVSNTADLIFSGSNKTYTVPSSVSQVENLTIAGTNTVSAPGNLTVSGTMAVNGTFTTTASQVITGGTLNGSGTVQVTRVGGSSSFADQFNFTNRTTTGLTLEMAGASAQGLDALSVAGLTIANTSGVMLNGAVLVSGALTLNAGNLDLNGFALTAGAIANGSSSRYIIMNGGTVTRTALNGTQAFPIGISTGSYSPVTVTNTLSRNWTVGVIDGFRLNQPTANSTKAILRTWDITPSAAPGATDLVFEYNEGDADIQGASWNTSGSVLVNHHNGTAWEVADGMPQSQIPGGTAGGVRTVTITGQTAFSPFAISQVGSPLPVTFLSFSGKREGGTNKLKWATSSESGNKGFEVERSADGSSFTKVGFLPSAIAGGNSNSVLNYNYSDIVAMAGGSFYYRLRQVDLDGRSKLSPIVQVRSEKINVVTLQGLYPNPVRSSAVVLLLEAPARTIVTLSLTDAGGRNVWQKTAIAEAGANSLPLEIGVLAAGNYYLKAHTVEGGTTTLKVVKQ